MTVNRHTLGRLDYMRLEDLRIQAHAIFDRLWMGGQLYCRRKDAYRWLAHKMGITDQEAHFSEMGKLRLIAAIKVCLRGNRKAVVAYTRRWQQARARERKRLAHQPTHKWAVRARKKRDAS